MSQLLSTATVWWHAHWHDVLWIVAFIALGRLGLGVLAKRIVKHADDGDDARESGKEKRAKTVASLVRATGNGVIATVAVVMLLRLFGVDTVPLLAGAGVLGVAIGVSLQALIKDVVFGFYLVAENQFAVGDKVKIGEHEGTVHKTNLRVTQLLDDEGNLIFIANGSVTTVVNYSLGEALKEKSGKPDDAPAAAPAPAADTATVVAAAPAPEPPSEQGPET